MYTSDMLSVSKQFPEAPVIGKPYDATALLDAVHRALRPDDTRSDRVITGIKPPSAIASRRLSPTFSRRTLSSIFSTQSSGIM
jgi:hypothetical protein